MGCLDTNHINLNFKLKISFKTLFDELAEQVKIHILYNKNVNIKEYDISNIILHDLYSNILCILRNFLYNIIFYI